MISQVVALLLYTQTSAEDLEMVDWSLVFQGINEFPILMQYLLMIFL